MRKQLSLLNYISSSMLSTKQHSQAQTQTQLLAKRSRVDHSVDDSDSDQCWEMG